MGLYIFNSIIAGIFFYSALQFFFLGFKNKKFSIYYIFAVISLLQAVCGILEYYGLIVNDKSDFIIYRKAYYFLTAIINILFLYFIYKISSYKNSLLKWIYILSVLITFYINYNLAANLIAASGEYIPFQITGKSNLIIIYTFLFLLQFIVLIWYSLNAYYYIKKTTLIKENFLLYCVLFFLPGSINNIAIDFGIVHYPLSVYLYFLFILYINFKLIDYLKKIQYFENEIHKGEILLNEVFNNAPVSMIILDNNADIVKINKQGEKIGITVNDFKLKHSQAGDVLGCIIAYQNNQGCGNGKECSGCTLRNSIKSTLDLRMGVVKVPYQMLLKNKEKREILISTSHFIVDEKPMVLLILEDVTSTVKAKDALIESEFRYRQIAKAITDYIYTIIVNEQGEIQTIQTSACLYITGYSAEEFEKNPNLWFEIIVPEDRDRVINFIKNVSEASEKQKVEYRIIKKDGESCWVLNFLVLKKRKGLFAMYDGVIRDITYRKQSEEDLRVSEEKFRNIFNTSSDGIIITDFESRVLEINQISMERSGLVHEDLRDKRLVDIFPTVPANEAIQALKSLPTQKKAIFQTSYINFKGEKIYIEIAGHLILYNGKEAALLISRDITDRVMSQQKILNAIINAEEKERRIFSQELHDGIGPILSTIKLYLQLIQNPESKSNKVEVFHDALDTIEEAITSIKEISNKLSPNILNKFGLATALQSFVKKIECLGKIQFDMQISNLRRLKPEIESMLYRVCVEAINNSVKYSQASKIIIKINADDNGLSLVIRDNGLGFDVNKIVSEKKGNGLFNMQNRVETFEGTFLIKSNPDEGTEINISIPDIFTIQFN